MADIAEWDGRTGHSAIRPMTPAEVSAMKATAEFVDMAGKLVAARQALIDKGLQDVADVLLPVPE